MKVMATHHIALRTPNLESMEQFYTQVLGFRVIRRWDHRRNILIDAGSTAIELLGRDETTAGARPNGGWDHLAFHVEDVDAAVEELANQGVQIVVEPRNLEEVRIAFFADPDGNLLELVEDSTQA